MHTHLCSHEPLAVYKLHVVAAPTCAESAIRLLLFLQNNALYLIRGVLHTCV